MEHLKHRRIKHRNKLLRLWLLLSKTRTKQIILRTTVTSLLICFKKQKLNRKTTKKWGQLDSNRLISLNLTLNLLVLKSVKLICSSQNKRRVTLDKKDLQIQILRRRPLIQKLVIIVQIEGNMIKNYWRKTESMIKNFRTSLKSKNKRKRRYQTN